MKKSSHLPKNTTFMLTPGLRAEIFWQTTNCDHFMENYRADLDAPTAKSRFHNLRFSQVSKMLSGNLYITQSPKSDDPNNYYAISSYGGKYYFTTFTIESRTDCPDTLFAVIITSYITYEDRHIKKHKAYVEELRRQFNR
ncbi:hypothetical protein G8759_19795 [Spirosoma aureum]|uniref:Uncharacterized protein n=1 Tax=Spirosoma aureum TaxID=2692134 RepID=A0A6G9AQT0_9BACT|nr:hypothetical protein [Spirosoma aureum]QIP14694.1 hypothetical protein G8759_19795 [Spirosoma aureum]